MRSATAILVVENVEFRDCERALDFNGIYTSSFRTNIFVSLRYVRVLACIHPCGHIPAAKLIFVPVHLQGILAPAATATRYK